ncbi:helix-turn-helix domain-containing protein [Flammeovirga yaeyamensis]|uniref:Helix-turn-helix domain-containing protein n=1 Tax=Flammeovirga yaeyamensis TaxID=367791 RepID=A0AAX1NCL6_9BACT|nr:AraC family transcriptional regulator [Flammeovirga yaeyamensis]MBB3696749.1 AraC-like DNA-binding protein [Flammeovirga yaeyamensis]NMF33417.1 helix-turn-helix transcriptional regulator [Flammeovirga yaeyamensis]QWG05308.1 helix-turn-helix domain-containing protein [Flammeovirga yaeyamensis]
MKVVFDAGRAESVIEQLGRLFDVTPNNHQIEKKNDDIYMYAEIFSLQPGIDLTIIQCKYNESINIIRKGHENNEIIPLTISNFSTYHKERKQTLLNNNNKTYELAWSNTKSDTYVDIPKNEEIHFLTIRIHKSVMGNLKNDQLQLIHRLLNSHEEFTFYHFCTYKMVQLIENIFSLKGDRDWKVLMMKALGFQFLAEFYLLISQDEKNTLVGYEKLQYKRVFDIKKFILKNLEENLSLQYLSEQFFISESSIQKDFKKVFNQSPYQIIKEERLKKAKDLLQNSDYPINQIAIMLRYKNASHFTLSVKNKYGMLPKDLRKMIK